MGRARVILFAEPASLSSRILVRAALATARARDDVEIVAVCDAGRRPPPGRRATARRAAGDIAHRLFDPPGAVPLGALMVPTVHASAHNAGVPVVVPPGRDVNHPDFINRVRGELHADFGLMLVCLQILRADLLGAFRATINFHDAFLPAYRGLRATAWSIYGGETATGFSFHRVDQGVDTGNVLVEGRLPLSSSSKRLPIEYDKSQLASRSLDAVWDAMLRGDPGRTQQGRTAMFRRKQLQAIRDIGDASTVDWDDLDRRIRAFDFVRMRLAGRRYHVTRLRRLHAEPLADRRLAFRTRDGAWAEPAAIDHLPTALYRGYRLLRR